MDALPFIFCGLIVSIGILVFVIKFFTGTLRR